MGSGGIGIWDALCKPEIRDNSFHKLWGGSPQQEWFVSCLRCVLVNATARFCGFMCFPTLNPGYLLIQTPPKTDLYWGSIPPNHVPPEVE